MKIAVISDIHGNLTALDAVMNDIKENGCEQIFCLGDYVMAGPEPIETLNWFFDKSFDPTFTLIQGNTDLMLADYNEDLFLTLKSKAPVMAEALKADSSLINHIQKDFLRTLPIQKEVLVNGVKFLLVHGSPRKNNEDIMPETPIKEVEKIIDGVDADVILCGHTHIPCGFQTSTKQTVVNVGSVGRPFTAEPKSCYLVITIVEGKCLFEHRFVEYDNNKSAEILKKRDFFGAFKLADTLLNPKIRHF